MVVLKDASVQVEKFFGMEIVLIYQNVQVFEYFIMTPIMRVQYLCISLLLFRNNSCNTGTSALLDMHARG